MSRSIVRVSCIIFVALATWVLPAQTRAGVLSTQPLGWATGSYQYRLTACNVHGAKDIQATLCLFYPSDLKSEQCTDSSVVTIGPNTCTSYAVAKAASGLQIRYGQVTSSRAKSLRVSLSVVNQVIATGIKR